MRIIFFLGHPAHYHLFKNVIGSLIQKGHEILVLYKSKDVLEELLVTENWPSRNIYIKQRRHTKLSLIASMLVREVKFLAIALQFKPDLLIGTSIEISHVGRVLRTPSLLVNEDDVGAVPLFAGLSYPFADWIVAPACCSVGRWEEKRIAYEGYHELAYLDKEHFSSKARVGRALRKDRERYYLLRFSGLAAHHDKGKKGIGKELTARLIGLLNPHGHVYITSEKELSPELERFRIGIPATEIHHAIAEADACIGDSQTIAAEAAVLGTPSLRFNDFVGKITYLEELEQRYRLTFGFRTSEADRFVGKVEELVRSPGLKSKWRQRREKMLSEKIDVCRFFLWLVEDYPESVRIMKADADFQFRFQPMTA